MKFREHRGSLAESMQTCITINSIKELERYLIRTSAPWERNLRELIARHGLDIAPYGEDERLDWNTHIVTLAGYGVLGFTDGPVPPVSRASP